MSRKLQPVTRQDAVVEIVLDIMDTLVSAIQTIGMIIPCLADADHLCHFDLMLEKEWIHQPDDAPLEGYVLTEKGGDAFCRQYLEHSYEKGPVVELVNELFDRDSKSIAFWKNEVIQGRINSELV